MKPANKILRILLPLAVAFVWGCDSGSNNEKTIVPGSYAGHVVRLPDGDTFTLLLEGNKQLKVRLYGIDAPEKGQDFGDASREKMQQLTSRHTISIEEKDRDRYGRTVGIAWRNDGMNLNEEMLRTGFAWHYKAYDKNEHWGRLEEQARKKRIGLWAQKDPTPPWQWRKQKREAQ